MPVRLIRFIRGYADFEAEGKFPERFLNITSKYGIALWNAEPKANGLKASMYACDYKKIRSTAKKARVRLRVTKKHGLPFFIASNKNRIGIPIGAALGTIVVFVLSGFLWSVSVTGTKDISETYLTEKLREYGVCAGAFKGNVDVDKIKRAIMLEEKEIGWMSINISGSVAVAEIKETAPKPKILESKPCNIKASADGVITKIKAQSGKIMLPEGSGVAKGDLLVSGITEGKQGSVSYVHAQAEVYANVNSEKELYIPKSYAYANLGEAPVERKSLRFLCFEFPCNLSFESFENSISSNTAQSLYLNNTVLPAQIKTQTDFELKTEKTELTREQAQKIFDNELMLYECFKKEKSRLISRKCETKQDKNGYICTSSYSFNENIAQISDFSVTER